MRIEKHGKIGCFIGKRRTCVVCSCEFIIDDVDDFEVYTFEPFVANVRCPDCGNIMRIESEEKTNE